MTNIEIIRFRAWLEIGGEPDGPEDGSQGTVFPITYASVTASLNSIPVATVTIATGTRMQDGKISPIHGKAGVALRNPHNWPWCRIYFRNLQTLETVIIFEGFVEHSGQGYSFASTEINLTIRHWLYALDAHPSISSVTHPSSVAAFTQMLFFKSLPGSVGGGGVSDEVTGLVFKQMLDEVFEGGADAFGQDIIQNGLMEMLRFLTRLSEEYTPWDISGLIDENILKPDIPLSVETIMAKRIKAGDTLRAQLGPDEFPILKIQSRDNSDDIAERMYHAMGNIPIESLQLNSVWAALIQMAAQFGIMLVPRVHELRFIPKWFTPKINDIKRLKGVVSVNGNWDYARPVGAAIVLPTSLDGKAVSAIDAPGMLNLEDSNAMSVYGTYQPPHGRPGTMLVRQRADWAGNIVEPSLPKNPGNMDQNEANQATAMTDDGQLPAEKEADGRYFYDALAEEAYWDEGLKGRKADVVCPIRFDVCPGSTVRIKTGGDVRLEARNGDQLTTEFVGFVLSMKLTFDTINASASAQYALTHVRDTDAQKDLLEHHPIYQCGPFSNATWTKKRFKTIEGSE